jgi:hypothetical protein
MRVIYVRKRELPLPVVVEDDDGQKRVMEMAPAREGKLGAFLRDAGQALCRLVLRPRK